MPYIFDAEPFGGTAQGEWPDEWIPFIHALREYHPELAAWGDLAIGTAWGQYSQDILAVGWCDWIHQRNVAFLAYIHVRLSRPAFDFGGTGLYFEKIEALSDAQPWLTGAALPEWTLQ